MHPQKSPIYPHVHIWEVSYEQGRMGPNMSAKRPNASAKEPYASAKEPCISAHTYLGSLLRTGSNGSRILWSKSLVPCIFLDFKGCVRWQWFICIFEKYLNQRTGLASCGLSLWFPVHFSILGVVCDDSGSIVYFRNTQTKEWVSHLVVQVFVFLYISRFWGGWVRWRLCICIFEKYSNERSSLASCDPTLLFLVYFSILEGVWFNDCAFVCLRNYVIMWSVLCMWKYYWSLFLLFL